jgi:hypothetical protein
MKKHTNISTIVKNVSSHARPAPKPLPVKRVLAAANEEKMKPDRRRAVARSGRAGADDRGGLFH